MLRLTSILLVLSLTFLAGCSDTPDDQPDLATVTGKVTLNGEPVEDAQIMFDPGEAARGSNATTNAEGVYELVYLKGAKGAVVGDHKVTISTKVEDEDTLEVVKKETMPKEYANGEITKTVKEGENTIDFDIKSGK